MSTWVELHGLDFIITTGDGKVHKPFWMNAKKGYDFNIARFDFKHVQGTLVKRGTAKGTEYKIEIIFQGAQHLDEAKAFDDSAKDPRAWNIQHPFYGRLYVQPTTLDFDNTQLNQSIITCVVVQTLTDAGLTKTNDPATAVPAQAVMARTNLNQAMADDIKLPAKTSFLQNIRKNMQVCRDFVLSKMGLVQAEVDTVKNYYIQVNQLINQSIFDTLTVADAATDLLVAPVYFTTTVVSRLVQLTGTLALFNSDVDKVLAVYGNPVDVLQRKLLYENNAGNVISAICEATMTGVAEDYNYRPDVLAVIGTVLDSYNTYVANLNRLQSLDGSLPTNYVPDSVSIQSLHDLASTTTSALFAIYAGAKQQRTKTLIYDSNLILEAWELYGLLPDDSTILTLKANNNIGLDEIFVLKAGRQIVYYV